MSNKVRIVVLGVQGSFRGQELVKALQLQSKEVEVFWGRNSSQMSNLTFRSNFVSWLFYGRKLLPSETACTWGHRAIMERSESSGLDWLLILEDNLSHEGLTEVVKFLENSESSLSGPSIINFNSQSIYLLIFKRKIIGSYKLGRTFSLPTLTKCYAINSKALLAIQEGQKNLKSDSFQADFPPFIKRFANFYCIDGFSIKLTNAKSLIGKRQSLNNKSNPFRAILKIFRIFLGMIFGAFRVFPEFNFTEYCSIAVFRSIARIGNTFFSLK